MGASMIQHTRFKMGAKEKQLWAQQQKIERKTHERHKTVRIVFIFLTLRTLKIYFKKLLETLLIFSFEWQIRIYICSK